MAFSNVDATLFVIIIVVVDVTTDARAATAAAVVYESYYAWISLNTITIQAL